MTAKGVTINGQPAPEWLMEEFADWLEVRHYISREEHRVAQWFADFLTEKYGKPVTGVSRLDPGRIVHALPDP